MIWLDISLSGFIVTRLWLVKINLPANLYSGARGGENKESENLAKFSYPELFTLVFPLHKNILGIP